MHRYLAWWGAETPLAGSAPVVAVQGNRVHLLLLILAGRLPDDLRNALGARPIAVDPETMSALGQLCWHLPRWLPVLATRTPRRAVDFQLYSVDSWDDTSACSLELHRAPECVDGRSLLLSALVALVSDLVDMPASGETAFSADLDFSSGRLAPVGGLDRKQAGVRVMLPNVRLLVNGPADQVPQGAESVTRAEQVLSKVGLSNALVERLMDGREQSLRQLVEVPLAGRSLLHSWNAVANGATMLLGATNAEPDERMLLRFVHAVALRHDGREPDIDEMPAMETLCSAAHAHGAGLDPDEVRAHWVQHFTDLVFDVDAQSLAMVTRRLERIEADLRSGNAVWPAALKLLGAWARYRSVLGAPHDWAGARQMAMLAVEGWLCARLGHEASYPLSEAWRLTGALPYNESRYREMAEWHERWEAQTGAVTADNYAYVLLSRARAEVLCWEGLGTASGAGRDFDPPGRRALERQLDAIADGKVLPDVPHVRAGAMRWRMAVCGRWPRESMARLAETDRMQHWLAGLDERGLDGEAQGPPPAPTRAMRRWADRLGEDLASIRRGSPY